MIDWGAAIAAFIQTGRKNREIRWKAEMNSELFENESGEKEGQAEEKEGEVNPDKNKKALCRNRGPSNDCLPYEKRWKSI